MGHICFVGEALQSLEMLVYQNTGRGLFQNGKIIDPSFKQWNTLSLTTQRNKDKKNKVHWSLWACSQLVLSFLLSWHRVTSVQPSNASITPPSLHTAGRKSITSGSEHNKDISKMLFSHGLLQATLSRSLPLTLSSKSVRQQDSLCHFYPHIYPTIWRCYQNTYWLEMKKLCSSCWVWSTILITLHNIENTRSIQTKPFHNFFFFFFTEMIREFCSSIQYQQQRTRDFSVC